MKKCITKTTIKLIHSVLLLSGLAMIEPTPVWAGCSIHNHNCLHGAYPIDPRLGDVPTGTPTLTVTTNYGGAPDVDVNQHFGLPIGRGPYLASSPDGNPVEATPLGGGTNVIYHNQQVVQYSNGSAAGALLSAPGSENTILAGNVPEGTYLVALYHCDINYVGVNATFSTGAVAGGTGHFDAPAASHIATPFIQDIALLAGSLAPDQASGVVAFNYYDNNYNPHASGIYVIPDGVWNLGGVPTNNVFSQFATADRSQGFVIQGGLIYDVNPFDLELVPIYGFDEYVYDVNSGLVFNMGTRWDQDAGREGQGKMVPGISGIVTDPNLLIRLQSGLQVTSDIAGLYGEDFGSGDVKGFARDRFNDLRRMANCPHCTEAELLALSKGSTIDGLSPEQKLAYDLLAVKAHSAKTLYQDLKSQRRRGYVKAGIVVAAAIMTAGAANAMLAPAAGGGAAGSAAAVQAAHITNAAAAAGAGGATAVGTASWLTVGAINSGVAFGGTLALCGSPKDALKSGLTSFAFSGVDVMNLGSVADTGAKALVGGTASDWAGGEFEEGFITTGATVGSSHIYRQFVGFDIDVTPGDDPAQPKFQDTSPYINTDNVGCASASPCSFLGIDLTEGSPVTRFLNQIPSFNGVAGFHDQIQAQTTGAVRRIINFPGILPSIAITGLGALGPGAPILVTNTGADK